MKLETKRNQQGTYPGLVPVYRD